MMTKVKRSLTRGLLLTAAALLTAVWLGGCGGETDVNRIEVNEVTHSVFYAPFYAAIELGYFADCGLEIALTNGGGSDNAMTALLTGAADISLLGPETAVYVINEGASDPPVIVAQLTKRDGSFLLGKTPQPDFSWSDLAGQSIIGGRSGGMPEMTLEYVLKHNGLIPGEDLTVRTDVDFDLMSGAFIAGDDGYVTAFEPTASTMERAGQGYIVASVGAAAGECPYTCFMVRQSYLEAHRELVEDFVAAIYRGQRYVLEHSAAEVAATIAPAFADSDVDLLTAVVQNYQDIDVWKEDPAMREADYQQLLAVIREAGVIESGPDFTAIVNNEIAAGVR